MDDDSFFGGGKWILSILIKAALLWNTAVILWYILMVFAISLTSIAFLLGLFCLGHNENQSDPGIIIFLTPFLFIFSVLLLFLLEHVALPLKSILIKYKSLRVIRGSNEHDIVFRTLSQATLLLFSVLLLCPFWQFCAFLDEHQTIGIFVGSIGIYFITFAVFNPLELLFDSSFKLNSLSISEMSQGAFICLVCIQVPAISGLILQFLPPYQHLIGTFVIWIGMIYAFRGGYVERKDSTRKSWTTIDVQHQIIPQQSRQIRYSNPYNNHDAEKISHRTEESAMAEVQRMKRQGLPNAHRLVHYYNRDLDAWFVGKSKYD